MTEKLHPHSHAASLPDAAAGRGWDFFAMDCTWYPGFAHLASTGQSKGINPIIKQMQLAGKVNFFSDSVDPTSAHSGFSFRRLWCLESDQSYSVV